jgi:hypothetical protein
VSGYGTPTPEQETGGDTEWMKDRVGDVDAGHADDAGHVPDLEPNGGGDATGGGDPGDPDAMGGHEGEDDD